jgi:hypothetical protein
MIQRKTIVYGIILQVSEKILEEVKSPFKDSSKKPKKIRGKKRFGNVMNVQYLFAG